MVEIFEKNINTINKHIKNIYEVGEIGEKTTIWKNRIVQTEGTRQVEREVIFYNYEVVIACAPIVIHLRRLRNRWLEKENDWLLKR